MKINEEFMDMFEEQHEKKQRKKKNPQKIVKVRSEENFKDNIMIFMEI